MAELIQIHPDNPQFQKMARVVECLKDGGLIIYPTDTIYGIGCDLTNNKAMEKICRFKGVPAKKINLSFICSDLSNLSHYAKNVSTPIFKIMKKALPGPFTFILESSSKVPKILGVKKKQVGIRVPNHTIPREIVSLLGNPLISTSVKHDDEVIEYRTNPELMLESFRNEVDIIIDAGVGGNVPSTVVNCIDERFEVLREGAGDMSEYIEYV